MLSVSFILRNATEPARALACWSCLERRLGRLGAGNHVCELGADDRLQEQRLAKHVSLCNQEKTLLNRDAQARGNTARLYHRSWLTLEKIICPPLSTRLSNGTMTFSNVERGAGRCLV